MTIDYKEGRVDKVSWLVHLQVNGGDHNQELKIRLKEADDPHKSGIRPDYSKFPLNHYQNSDDSDLSAIWKGFSPHGQGVNMLRSDQSHRNLLVDKTPPNNVPFCR
jgi:hypothetical protein